MDINRSSASSSVVVSQALQTPAMSIHDSDNYAHRLDTEEQYASFANQKGRAAEPQEENVQVFLRIRPPFQHEVEDTVFDPTVGQPGSTVDAQWSCTFTTQHDPQVIELMVPKERTRQYQFDHVFDDTVGQEDIFLRTCLPLVYNVLNGYNGTYFVYGQTGTGKTHTMGVLSNIDVDSQGIIPQSVDYILKILQEQEAAGTLFEWKVHLSFY